MIEWSGNKERQSEIAAQIIRIFGEDQILDVIAACETIIANVIADIAPTYEDALTGLQQAREDMRQVLITRYNQPKNDNT